MSNAPDSLPDSGPSVPTPRALPEGSVLVVEDNVIIALDYEMLLEDMGAGQVVVCSNVDQALERVARQPFAFALLDVDLGGQTSFPIADALKAKGVPILFASGYTDGLAFPAEYAAAPRVTKPFDQDALAEGIAAALTWR